MRKRRYYSRYKADELLRKTLREKPQKKTKGGKVDKIFKQILNNTVSSKKTKPGAFPPGFFMACVDKHPNHTYYKQTVVFRMKKEYSKIAVGKT